MISRLDDGQIRQYSGSYPSGKSAAFGRQALYEHLIGLSPLHLMAANPMLLSIICFVVANREAGMGYAVLTAWRKPGGTPALLTLAAMIHDLQHTLRLPSDLPGLLIALTTAPRQDSMRELFRIGQESSLFLLRESAAALDRRLSERHLELFLDIVPLLDRPESFAVPFLQAWLRHPDEIRRRIMALLAEAVAAPESNREVYVFSEESPIYQIKRLGRLDQLLYQMLLQWSDVSEVGNVRLLASMQARG